MPKGWRIPAGDIEGAGARSASRALRVANRISEKRVIASTLMLRRSRAALSEAMRARGSDGESCRRRSSASLSESRQDQVTVGEDEGSIVSLKQGGCRADSAGQTMPRRRIARPRDRVDHRRQAAPCWEREPIGGRGRHRATSLTGRCLPDCAMRARRAMP